MEITLTRVCLCCAFFSGIPLMNRTLLGICAMDYPGDDLYPSPDTPGLIVDDVNYFEQCAYALTNQFLGSLGLA